MEMLKLSLRRKTAKVSLEQEDGTTRVYTIREISGAERDEYLTSLSRRMKVVDGKPQGVSNFDGLQGMLLAKALLDETGQPVPLETIQGFPSSVLQALFSQAQELSGLNQDTKEGAEKNV